MIVDFQEVACAAIGRGFAVIPLVVGGKDPDTTLVGRENGEAGTGGAARRTRDPKKVAEWAALAPHANVGVCSDERVTILESDNEQQFRQLVRDVSRNLFGESRELPATLTSQARPNRPHFFFLATERTRTTDGSPAIQGMFEWRRENQYVVGAGSLHPSGVKYQYVCDVPMVPFPDWLVDVLLEIRRAYRGESSRASNFVRVGPAAIARDALISQYMLDVDAMIADNSFTLQVDAGERHYFLQSMAGLLHDGSRDQAQLAEDLRKLNARYCADGGKGDYEIENLARWTSQKPPVTIEPFLPADPRVTVGGAKRAGDIAFARPERKTERNNYVLEPTDGERYNGWFMRGACNIIAGSSGAGKSTLILDILDKQKRREYVCGHRGAGLDYLVIFADRGRKANDETLERLGLENARVPVAYITPGNYDILAVDNIKELIEAQREIPEVVFIEGADLLVSDPNKTPEVGAFVLALQRVAEHYDIAIIFSCGSPKTSKQNEPTQRRDRVFGSQAWARTCCTIAVLTSEDDGTTQFRKLTVQHRNAPTELFELQFQSGHLREVSQKDQAATDADVLVQWAASATTFSFDEAFGAMKNAGTGYTRNILRKDLERLVKSGTMTRGLTNDSKIFWRLTQAAQEKACV